MEIKTDKELKIMAEGGKISKKILDFGLSKCVAGITTKDIDSLIQKKMSEFGVKPWFNTVNDYNFVSCISVNDSWLHGKPNDVCLKVNDVVKIDTGISIDGYHLDNCWTIVINENMDNIDVRDCISHPDLEVNAFLRSGIKTLFNAIDKARDGNRVGDISYVLQSETEKAGYNVIRGFGGHGIGKKHWEDPHIPCVGTKGAGPKLKNGMVVAIEIMNTMGKWHHYIDNDKWTVKTSDGKISSMYEHTIAITANGPVILTN